MSSQTKFLSLALFLLLVINPLFGQGGDQLTIDLVFSHELSPELLHDIRWMKNDQRFTRLEYTSEGEELSFYDIKKGDWETLVKSNQLKTPDGNGSIEIEDYSWSSDEKQLLIFTNSKRVWRQNTRGDYWVYDMDSGSLHQIGRDHPESSLMFAKFSPDNLNVAYVSQSNLYVEEVSSGQVRQLTKDGTVDVINGTFDWAYEEEFSCRDGFRWSDDGKKIAFWQVDATDIKDFIMINNTDSIYSYTIPVQYPKVGQDPSSAKIGVIDLSTENITWQDIPGDSKQHYLPRMQWLPDNEHLLVQQLNRKQNHLKIYHCEASTGSSRVVYEEKESAWIEIFGVDISMKGELLDLPIIEDGKSFLLLSEKDGWRHVYKVQIQDGSEQLVTPGDYDVATNYALDEKRNVLYINASPDNATQRYLYKASTSKIGAPERLTPEEFPGVNLYDLSPDVTYAIHEFSNINTPTSYTLIRLKDHKQLTILKENENLKEKLSRFDLPSIEFFKTTTSDGIEMDGWMMKPHNFDESKKYPVLFYVYGEPWGQTAVDSWSYFLWHQFIAQQGYIVVSMDNRGTPSIKGREWRKSIYRKIGVINSRDQAMAAKEVLKWPFIDKDRVAVWGWSGGGSMTLNLLFRYPELFQTGMSIAAVANQLYYDNIYQERYMGVPWENEEDFKEGSPITYAKNLSGNLLYIHGTADDNVHYQNAEALINELVAQGKQFDLMIYPNRSHGIYEGEGTTVHLRHLMYRYLTEHTPPGPK